MRWSQIPAIFAQPINLPASLRCSAWAWDTHFTALLSLPTQCSLCQSSSLETAYRHHSPKIYNLLRTGIQPSQVGRVWNHPNHNSSGIDLGHGRCTEGRSDHQFLILGVHLKKVLIHNFSTLLVDSKIFLPKIEKFLFWTWNPGFAHMSCFIWAGLHLSWKWCHDCAIPKGSRRHNLGQSYRVS